MKKFKISYHPLLGGFLDAKRIEWHAINNTNITITCKDASELFSIAIEYAKWYEKINAICI